MNQDQAREKYGGRIQRCSGCFGAFYLRDMWLAEEATFYCGDCKNSERMFHFDDFSRRIDLASLPSLQEDETTQCQNPFTRQT